MANVRRCDVPDCARELADLRRIDYADCFAVDVSTQHSPEEWVRQCVAQMPSLFAAIRVAHRSLGLKIAREDSPDHVFGWEIVRSGPTEAVLANHGLLGSPRIVGLTPPGQVTLATLIELNGLTGRLMWGATAPVHRAVAQGILRSLPTLSVATPVAKE